MVVSYQQLIKDYYENFDSEYELEYPEFKEYKKYLTLSNLKTLGYNKDKALEEISKKKSTKGGTHPKRESALRRRSTD